MAPGNIPEPIGGLNRVFGQACKIRLLGKQLKQRSRTGYCALKWTLIAGTLVLIFI